MTPITSAPLSDEDPALPFVVEWYRPSPRKGILHASLKASALLLTGMVLAWSSLYAHIGLAHDTRVVLALLFVLGTGSAPLYLSIALRRLVADETSIILRSDALIHIEDHGGEDEHTTTLDWGEVMGAEVTESGDLRILLRDATPYIIAERYAGTDNATLARRIEDIRRKALMGLLHHKRLA